MTAYNDLGLIYRPAEPAELDFILDSWLKSYRTSPWAGVVRNHRYHEETRGTIEDLLGRGAKLTVASAPDTGRVLGWVCHESKQDVLVIHYIYVKDPFRKLGVGKSLIESLNPQGCALAYTFRTRASKYIVPGALFAPEIARRKSL